MRRGAAPLLALACALAALTAAPESAQEATPAEPPPLPPLVRARTAAASCSAFLPEDRPACARRLAEYQRRIRELEATRAGAGPEESCRLHCEMLHENWQLRDATRGWSERALRTMASGAYDRRNAALAEREAQRRALGAERAAAAAELADLRKGRVLHVYENGETGALVEHAGEPFEPRPPLRYVGERRAAQVESGRRRMAELEERIAALDARLQGLAGQPVPVEPADSSPDGTERMLEAMWAGHCDAAEADGWLAACHGRCAGQPVEPVRECPF